MTSLLLGPLKQRDLTWTRKCLFKAVHLFICIEVNLTSFFVQSSKYFNISFYPCDYCSKSLTLSLFGVKFIFSWCLIQVSVKQWIVFEYIFAFKCDFFAFCEGPSIENNIYLLSNTGELRFTLHTFSYIEHCSIKSIWSELSIWPPPINVLLLFFHLSMRYLRRLNSYVWIVWMCIPQIKICSKPFALHFSNWLCSWDIHNVGT